MRPRFRESARREFNRRRRGHLMGLFERLKGSSRVTALLVILALIVFSPAGLRAQSEEKSKSEKQEKDEKAGKSQKTEEESEEGTTRLRIEVVAGEKAEPVDSASVYIRFVRPRT